jgi:DNA repair exonuclease SbcCD ATPase subunit
MRVETEKNYKYLIDPNSVEKRIKELQQALYFSNKTYQDMSGHVETNNETSLDMSGQGKMHRETPARNEEADYLRGRVEELENENVHLKISKQANEMVINQLNSERKEFVSQLNGMHFQLGEAQAKLQLLGAPRPEGDTRHVETKPVEQVSDAVEVASEAAPTPTQPAQPTAPAATPEPAKRNLLDRLLGR